MGIIRYIVEHKNVVPKPLKDRRSALLRQNWSGPRPPEPVIEVNEHTCAVNHSMHIVRDPFLLYLLIGLMVMGGWHGNELLSEWRNEEKHAKWRIESSKRAYGADYFQTTKNPIDIVQYKRINQDGVMPLRAFLRYHYFETADIGGTDRLIADIVFALLYAPFIPWLLYLLIRFPRYAPLYFDRDQQLIWTWRKGRLWAQRYDDLLISDSIQGLSFAVRKLRKNGRLKRRFFTAGMPGSPYYTTSESREALLGFVVRFMRYGKEQVWPGADYKIRPGCFLFEDKKPADAEQQIEALLRLSRDDVGKPPTSLRDGWSYGIKIVPGDSMKEKLKDTAFAVVGFLMILYFPLQFYEFFSLAMDGGDFFNSKSRKMQHVAPGDWSPWIGMIIVFIPALISTVLLLIITMLLLITIPMKILGKLLQFHLEKK